MHFRKLHYLQFTRYKPGLKEKSARACVKFNLYARHQRSFILEHKGHFRSIKHPFIIGVAVIIRLHNTLAIHQVGFQFEKPVGINIKP